MVGTTNVKFYRKITKWRTLTKKPSFFSTKGLVKWKVRREKIHSSSSEDYKRVE